MLVVDSDSTDGTAQIARQMGPRSCVSRGVYMGACLTGLPAVNAPEVVVFLDGDYSDHPAEVFAPAGAAARSRYDIVIYLPIDHGVNMAGLSQRGFHII